MPIYEFDCSDCGLRFEKMRKMSESDEPSSCPSCGVAGARRIISPVNHSFAHTPVGGPRPQNTGVYSLDHSYDQVIGRDAEAKWKAISERQKHKVDVIKSNPGSTGFDLSRTHEGDYRVMSSAERQTVENARKLHSSAMSAIETSKSSGKGEG